jgi:hypothetical protein
MAKDSKGHSVSGEFDAGPDKTLLKARQRQMNRAWTEATVGEGFMLPFALVTRPKRTLVLGLGLGAFVFTVGGLYNLMGAYIVRGKYYRPQSSGPGFSRTCRRGGVLDKLTDDVLREIQQRVGDGE